MSQYFDQNATVYSDEASMANGNNGESMIPMVIPQAIQKLEMGMVPQAQAQPVVALFWGAKDFRNYPSVPVACLGC